MAQLNNTKTESAPLDLSKWSKLPVILAVVGGLGVIAGLFVDKQQLGYSYLLAFMFFLSLALGGLFLVLLHHLFDSSWSVPIRRVCEHLAALLPVLGILFIPILLLAKEIYPWMNIDPATDHALHAKDKLINPTVFVWASIGIFLIWTLLSLKLRSWSIRQDADGAARCTRAMRFHAAWGIFAFAITLTLGAIFWMKSLEHQWFSTMYGVYYFAESVWFSLATVYLITYVAKRAGVLKVAHDRQFRDLGVLMLTFTIFYAYIHFSQYFLIWNAAIPEETFWYVQREHGTWKQVGYLLIFGHFLLPFLALLRIDVKYNPLFMVPLIIWFWMMHFVDMAFNIKPVQQVFKHALEGKGGTLSERFAKAMPDNFTVHWMDLACLAFFGGVLTLIWLKYFRSAAPYPIRDPRLQESLIEHDNLSDALASAPTQGTK